MGWTFWGNFILAFIVTAAVYAVFMSFYFLLRRKITHPHFFAEICIVFLALVFSFAMRCVVSAQELIQEGEPVNGFNLFLYALYGGVGGITFEGIDYVSGAWGWLYLLSVVNAGLIALSVITAKASYQIYCFVYLHTRGLFFRFSRRRDFYIFTTVTEDTLLLANDISARYKKDGSLKGRIPVILFAGSELGAFDSKDPLHRELMRRGYYFSSYSDHGVKRQRSIVKRFHMDVGNDFFLSRRKRSGNYINSRVHVFSLGISDDLTGFEAQNSELIFNEISVCLSELAEGRVSADWLPMRGTIVNFHLLTNNKIDFQVYDNECKKRVRGILEKKFGSDWEEKVRAKYSDPDAQKAAIDKIINRWSSYIQLHVFNEAILAAENLSEKRYSMNDGRLPLRDRPLCEPNKPDVLTYRAMILGFGETGKAAMNALYADTVDVRNGNVSRFLADVYDINIERNSGSFALMHPHYLCVDCSDALEEKSRLLEYDDAEFQSEKDRICSLYRGASKLSDEQVLAEMGFPAVVFHKQSCFALSFAQFLDRNIGMTGGAPLSCKQHYNSFVIALGNDEDNLAMANMLIDDFKHERKASPEDGPLQIIYVNLRDEKNYFRLNWDPDTDSQRFPTLAVIPFGNREEMYSFRSVIGSEVDDFTTHYAYESAGSLSNDNELIDIVTHIEKNQGGEYAKRISSFYGKVRLPKNITTKAALTDQALGGYVQSWLASPCFTKQSNRAASRAGIRYHLESKGLALTDKELLRFVQIEHARWACFHIANGWQYRALTGSGPSEKAENKKLREHDCICPYSMLSSSNTQYDLFNFILGYSLK